MILCPSAAVAAGQRAHVMGPTNLDTKWVEYYNSFYLKLFPHCDVKLYAANFKAQLFSDF